MTLKKARKCGKLEKDCTAYHREPHMISKLLIKFVLSRIYQISINMKIVSKIFLYISRCKGNLFKSYFEHTFCYSF